MDLRNSKGIELRNFYFTTISGSFFFENFHQKWKNASCGAQFRPVLLNQVSKESFYTFEDIDLRESHAKLRVKLWEQIEFKG